MKLIKKPVALVTTVVATLLGSSAMADNLWQTIDFEFSTGPDYISCLGEPVSWQAWGTIRFREFETPSQNSHYIDYWTWDSVWIGEETERVWYSEGHSPDSFHIMKGEVGQMTSSEKARPYEGDGPMFRYNIRFKYTVSANGVWRVFYEPPVDLNDWIRCLGTKD